MNAYAFIDEVLSKLVVIGRPDTRSEAFDLLTETLQTSCLDGDFDTVRKILEILQFRSVPPSVLFVSINATRLWHSFLSSQRNTLIAHLEGEISAMQDEKERKEWAANLKFILEGPSTFQPHGRKSWSKVAKYRMQEKVYSNAYVKAITSRGPILNSFLDAIDERRRSAWVLLEETWTRLRVAELGPNYLIYLDMVNDIAYETCKRSICPKPRKRGRCLTK